MSGRTVGMRFGPSTLNPTRLPNRTTDERELLPYRVDQLSRRGAELSASGTSMVVCLKHFLEDV